MRVDKSVWNAAVNCRPSLITQFRMYCGGSDRECADTLLDYGSRLGFVTGRNVLRGKTLANWSSVNIRVAPPFWVGLTAAHFILTAGFAGNEETLKAAIAHLLNHHADMSAFEKECNELLLHIDKDWLADFLTYALDKSA